MWCVKFDCLLVSLQQPLALEDFLVEPQPHPQARNQHRCGEVGRIRTAVAV
jgi:hypothetical protein